MTIRSYDQMEHDQFVFRTEHESPRGGPDRYFVTIAKWVYKKIEVDEDTYRRAIIGGPYPLPSKP